MSPDRQLLLACCRAHLAQQALERPTNRQVDWVKLLKVAQRLGVAALVRANLTRFVDHARIPRELMARFDSVYYEQALHNARLGASLSEILAACGRDGVPVIVLKGAFLAELVHGNIALRPMKDLDVLVRQPDLDRADRLVRALGYVPDESYRSAEWYRRHHHHLAPYRSGDGSSLLELHHHIFPPAAKLRVPVEDLWGRARPVVLSSGPALVLAPADLLLHLCVGLSAVDHFMGGLKTLCDIAAVVEQDTLEVDWTCLLESARMYGVEKHLYYGFWLAWSLLGAHVPMHVLETLRGRMRRPLIEDLALKRLIRTAVFRYGRDGSVIPAGIVLGVLAELLATKSGGAKIGGLLRLAALVKRLPGRMLKRARTQPTTFFS